MTQRRGPTRLEFERESRRRFLEDIGLGAGALAFFGLANTAAPTSALALKPIDNKRQVIEDLDWSAGDVAIEVRKSGKNELYRPGPIQALADSPVAAAVVAWLGSRP